MKTPLKDTDKMTSWEVQMQTPNIITTTSPQNRGQHLPKLLLYFTLFVSATYFLYTLKLVSHPQPCINADDDDGGAFTSTAIRHLSTSNLQRSTTNNNLTSSSSNLNSTTLLKLPSQSPPHPAPPPAPAPTNISHIVFGIGASSTLWEQRKNYIKIWYKPKSGMRGVVWLDQPVKTEPNDRNLPPTRISGGTDQFPYTNKQGQRSALRISRIVSETLRLGLKNVRWFVLGDDDTVFVPENLVRVLSKYDHNQYYYIGSNSESHLQNIYFSYAMAYGGGGFAISYPLAVALERMQDRCIHRYPGLYGSDDRIQACMAELGVPLTKELGFHQYDVYGNLFGLLAAHPVTPFVSLHHLDIVEPIFPDVTQVEALQRLQVPMRMDSAGLMQQSICYDRVNKWTISVSWGFAVQVIRGILSPREMEMPTRTFLNWYKRADYTAYAFNTRPVARNPCQKPFVFYLSKAGVIPGKNKTLSEYTRHRVPQPLCKWKLPDPSVLQNVLVFKSPDPRLWDKSPRRNCCRVMASRKKENMVIDVGRCKTDEVTEIDLI